MLFTLLLFVVCFLQVFVHIFMRNCLRTNPTKHIWSNKLVQFSLLSSLLIILSDYGKCWSLNSIGRKEKQIVLKLKHFECVNNDWIISISYGKYLDFCDLKMFNFRYFSENAEKGFFMLGKSIAGWIDFFYRWNVEENMFFKERSFEYICCSIEIY